MGTGRVEGGKRGGKSQETVKGKGQRAEKEGEGEGRLRLG